MASWEIVAIIIIGGPILTGWGFILFALIMDIWEIVADRRKQTANHTTIQEQ